MKMTLNSHKAGIFNQTMKVITRCRTLGQLSAARTYLRLASRFKRGTALSNVQRERLWSTYYVHEIRLIDNCAGGYRENLSLREFVVKYELTSYEAQKMVGPVPFSVQLRQKLNAHGFLFEDDGKPSSVINVNPTPLGKLTWEMDFETDSVFYKQHIKSG